MKNSTRNTARLAAPITRELVNPRTGDVFTLVYERTRTAHVVRCEVPFGYHLRPTPPTYTTAIEHARRVWSLIESNLKKRGLVVAK
jgi:hypothetical protein